MLQLQALAFCRFTVSGIAVDGHANVRGHEPGLVAPGLVEQNGVVELGPQHQRSSPSMQDASLSQQLGGALSAQEPLSAG
jgi:hypothetical protein